ncbi:MAG TPA: enoyl-CoA hydratase-related protein [Candidatus Binataceae bacterium]|nr:enoyl-CoA hydratase-related protein [Candidatus Binataceae bacterium]
MAAARKSRASGARDRELIVEPRGRCLSITLNRPRAGNRINPAMARELLALAERVEDDERLRMLALNGAGGVFCIGFEAGVDSRLVESIAALAKPTLAIIDGDVFDEGLELALALDIRIAAAPARFAITQPRRGILPHFGATQRLPRIVGAPRAMRMILTGTPIDGRAALAAGLVTELAASRASLKRIAAERIESILSRGPLAVRMAKEAVLKGYDMTLAQGIRLEEDLYALLQTTADRSEGVRAFLEKRKPLFKGA